MQTGGPLCPLQKVYSRRHRPEFGLFFIAHDLFLLLQRLTPLSYARSLALLHVCGLGLLDNKACMLQVRLVLDAHLRPSQRPSENLDILAEMLLGAHHLEPDLVLLLHLLVQLVKLLLVGHNQEIITVHSKFDITLDVAEVAHGPASLDEPNAIEILGVSLRPFLSRITCTF